MSNRQPNKSETKITSELDELPRTATVELTEEELETVSGGVTNYPSQSQQCTRADAPAGWFEIQTWGWGATRIP
jgi:bacteriocin-like protein